MFKNVHFNNKYFVKIKKSRINKNPEILQSKYCFHLKTNFKLILW